MRGRIESDVLVVGAGPCGLLAALALAEEGVSVEVIDEKWRQAGHSYALALHPRSLNILDGLGLAAQAVAQGRAIRSMSIFEGPNRRVTVPLGAKDPSFPFVLSLPQNDLETLLLTRLEAKGVKVRWNHRLADTVDDKGGVIARVDRLAKESSGYAIAHTGWVVDKSIEVRARYVIGADGHRSVVRRVLGTSFPEVGPSQVFAVSECQVRREAAEDDEMRVVLDDATVNVLWPLPDGRVRWSLELEDPNVHAHDRFKSRLTTLFGERYFPHLEEEQFRTLLLSRAPWFESSLEGLGWSIQVRFERRLAETLGKDHVWLAGDAAHLTGPAGMQSMNAGLHEARTLASAIGRIVRGHDGMDLLDDYGKRALAEWRFLLGQTGRLAAGPSALPFVAKNAGSLLPCLPATGPDIAQLAGALGLAIERD